VNGQTGEIVHDVKVFDTETPEHVASVNSYASPTPAIEAGRVYVHYGTYGTACLDTRDGKVLWSRRDLTCDHHEGPGSSVMLHKNLLCFDVDGRDVQYVIALDKNTGKTVWKTSRSIDYTPFSSNQRKAFCTPIILEAGGQLQLFSPGAKAMIAYDPQSGEELSKVRYNGWSMVPRPVFGQGLVYVITDYEKPELWAVRPDGQGCDYSAIEDSFVSSRRPGKMIDLGVALLRVPAWLNRIRLSFFPPITLRLRPGCGTRLGQF
jgi:outer membrane protein assembly factor BamB